MNRENNHFTIEFSEDFSNNIIKIDTSKCNKKFKDDIVYEYDTSICTNNNLISEASLSRMLTQIENRVFAILTAYRNGMTKEENILRNRKLRGILNQKKLGVHQLVGHFKELTDDAKNRGVTYNTATPNDLIEVIERSYLVVKTDSMSTKDFILTISNALTVDNHTQDSALINCSGCDDIPNLGYFLLYPSSNYDDIRFEKIGEKLSIGKIADIYSQHVKKTNVPFLFEGKEIPGSNSGLRLFNMYNYL